MKKIFIVLLICILTQITWAHDAHQQIAFPRKWNIESTHQTIDGTFYLFKNNTVFIENNEGNIKSFSFNDLSLNDQQFVQKRQASINALHAKPKPFIDSSNGNQFTIKLYLIIALLIFVAFQFFNIEKKKWLYVMPTVLVGGLVMSYSFTSKTLKKSTDITYLKSAFDPFRPNVNTRWDANYFYVESIGIPEHEMMKGITGWQQQFPIPQCYIGTNAWSIPINPVKYNTIII
jgi:hypothetical protein